MIPVMQTKRGGADVPVEERGDCLDACLASILEVPITEVPVPHTDEWWDKAQEAVGRYGYHLVIFDVKLGGPDVYWIAGVPSKNLKRADDTPELHSIVMRGWDVVHDPCLGDRYEPGPLPEDIYPKDGWVLVPLEYEQVAA